MTISATNRAPAATNPLSTLLSSSAQGSAKKADADDAAPVKAAPSKLATHGPGQHVDIKV